MPHRTPLDARARDLRLCLLGGRGPKLGLMRTDHEVTLTVDEVAARLRSTPSRIRDLIEEGELRFAPTTDINDIRVPESALAELPAALC